MQEANLRLEMDKTPDRQSTSVQDILAKSAFEKPSFANSSDKQDAPSASRAGMVLAQGLGEGIWAKTKDAVGCGFDSRRNSPYPLPERGQLQVSSVFRDSHHLGL